MPLMTLREFAIAVGASISAVQQAAHTGCLRSVVTKGPTGSLYVDEDSGKAAWSSRDQTRSLRARPAPPPAPTSTPPRARAAPVTPATPSTPPEARPSPPTEDDGDGEGDSLESVTIKQKLASARLADLRYRREVRELLVASDVAKEWAEVLTRVRAAMMAIPERLRQDFPELAQPVISGLDGLIRDALRGAI